MIKYLLSICSVYLLMVGAVSANENKSCKKILTLYVKSISSIKENSILAVKGLEDLAIIAGKDKHVQVMENMLNKYFSGRRIKYSFCQEFSEALDIKDSYNIPNKYIKYSEVFDPNFIKSMKDDAFMKLKASWGIAYSKKLDSTYNKVSKYKYINGCDKPAEILSEFIGNPPELGVGSRLFRKTRDIYFTCLKQNINKQKIKELSTSNEDFIQNE